MKRFPLQTRLGLALRFFQWHLVIMPVLVLYWLQIGLGMQDILILQAAFSMSIVLSEVPTGMISDSIGRVLTLRIGMGLCVLGHLLLAWGQGFEEFFIAELVLGISGSFLSGADSAFCFEHLKAAGLAGESEKLESLLTASSTGSEALAALWIGPVAAISLVAPFYVQAGVSLIGFILTLFMQEPLKERPPEKNSQGFFPALAEIRHQKPILSLFLLSAVSNATTLTAAFLIQPYAREGGVPMAMIGLYWAGLNATVAIFSLFNHRVGVLNSNVLLGLTLLLSLGAWGGMFLGPEGIFLAAPFLFSVMRGTVFPRLAARLHQKIADANRATIFSLQSLVFRLIFSGVGPVLGSIMDHQGAEPAYMTAAAVFGGLQLVFGLFWLKYN